MRSGEYDVAQVCLNGHVVNSSLKRFPQGSKNFCDKCGALTITNCPSCNTEIQGKYRAEGVIDLTKYIPPKFCPSCGKPYPWTEAKIQAAYELTREIENISEDDKKILSRSIDDIVKDTPRTTLGATRTKRILSKVSNSTVVDAFKKILVDIISETAKKIIWPS